MSGVKQVCLTVLLLNPLQEQQVKSLRVLRCLQVQELFTALQKLRVSMMNARTEKMREIMTEFMAVVPARSTVPVILLSSKWLSLKSLKIQPQM